MFNLFGCAVPLHKNKTWIRLCRASGASDLQTESAAEEAHQEVVAFVCVCFFCFVRRTSVTSLCKRSFFLRATVLAEERIFATRTCFCCLLFLLLLLLASLGVRPQHAGNLALHVLDGLHIIGLVLEIRLLKNARLQLLHEPRHALVLCRPLVRLGRRRSRVCLFCLFLCCLRVSFFLFLFSPPASVTGQTSQVMWTINLRGMPTTSAISKSRTPDSTRTAGPSR